MTNDPDRGNRGDSRIVTFPHAPGAHVCAAAPNFAFRSIKYDTSYVGTLSFPVRLTMAESVRRQQHLRYFLQHPNTLDWQDPQSSYLHMNDQEKKRALERLYVEKMAQSWTTLCPRGMGSVSIRFFETLCMGRIPVHISDAYILPRQEEIDYASFCLLLPESEAEHTGEILDEWLSGKSLEERAALCLTAREVWERSFRPEHFRQYALALLERNKLSQGAPTKPRRYVLGRHEWRGATGLKPYYTPDVFAHMELDDRRLWIVRGLEVGTTADGTVTVNGLPSRLAPSELTFLTEFASAQDVNAVLVSLAPTCATGVIALVNGLFLGRKLNATRYVAVAGDLPPWRRDLDDAGVDSGIRLVPLAPGETPADALRRFQPGSVHAVILESGDMDLADATPACLRPHGGVLQRNHSEHGFRLRPASPERLAARLFASVAMTTPFPGAFRPGRLMLGMLPPGDWPKVIPFVRSLRASGYTGETVLFAIDADPAAQRFLATNGCHGITAALQPNFRHVPAQCFRYFLYRTFLHQFGDAFDGGFLTDVDDVVVQGDVFAHLAPGCLTLFGTDGPVRERPGDAAWIRDLYGPDMLAAMGDSPAVCSGTILGEPPPW